MSMSIPDFDEVWKKLLKNEMKDIDAMSKKEFGKAIAQLVYQIMAEEMKGKVATYNRLVSERDTYFTTIERQKKVIGKLKERLNKKIKVIKDHKKK